MRSAFERPLVYGVLLRPLPFPGADRLLNLATTWREGTGEQDQDPVQDAVCSDKKLG